MTSARDQRDDDEGRRLVRLRQDPVLLSAPPLNAANDNERDLRLVAENCDSVMSVRLEGRTSFGTAVLIVVCVAMASMMAAGWIFTIALTLLNSINWGLSFFVK